VRNHIRVVLAGLMAASAAPLSPAQDSGANTYKAKCMVCHAADGSGNTTVGMATKTPSFNSLEMLKMSDADFIADTRDGKGKMPAYSGKLSDGQIKDVIAYVRTLQKK
jgi:cytochrome c6